MSTEHWWLSCPSIRFPWNITLEKCQQRTERNAMVKKNDIHAEMSLPLLFISLMNLCDSKCFSLLYRFAGDVPAIRAQAQAHYAFVWALPSVSVPFMWWWDVDSIEFCVSIPQHSSFAFTLWMWKNEFNDGKRRYSLLLQEEKHSFATSQRMRSIRI